MCAPLPMHAWAPALPGHAFTQDRPQLTPTPHLRTHRRGIRNVPTVHLPGERFDHVPTHTGVKHVPAETWKIRPADLPPPTPPPGWKSSCALGGVPAQHTMLTAARTGRAAAHLPQHHTPIIDEPAFFLASRPSPHSTPPFPRSPRCIPLPPGRQRDLRHS